MTTTVARENGTSQATSNHASSERVLVVEDDSAARSGLEQLIKSWGFVAESAVDGEDALEKMTGYSRAEAIGRTSAELGLVDAAARAKILRAIGEHGYVRDVEIQMHVKSNRIVDVLVSVDATVVRKVSVPVPEPPT